MGAKEAGLASACMLGFVFLLITAVMAYTLQKGSPNPLFGTSSTNRAKQYIDTMIAFGVIGTLVGTGLVFWGFGVKPNCPGYIPAGKLN